ncbi:Kae1-associated kinase Bud32 [Methanonatronarchaeum sp. AMET-Sl]|uniref:Kae1-associated kinase Bud32 n=1 Tax=Methanonatronarchaeum sp. AMET-Sl TaxID=3037654 RepID=UPI00244E352D|nr:Kae1-associated kinase Bud32 [Methanonatronarchaeum sp. AMET-Sl]WGI18161.1 Kae1-associated kinase Bud32 [Methanonatronarchaeum sp. AMET-Sl]
MKPKLIDRGAEAEIYLKGNKILKKRIPKKYRHPELDNRIRRERVIKETKITSQARQAGVPTPIILDIKNHTIEFEYIDGDKLKNIYNKLNPQQYNEIGKNIGKLHNAGLVHGDLTTSNMIKHKNKIYIIDFGLAEYDVHIEARGVDLHILFQSIKATHQPNNSIKQIKKGYKKTFPKHKKVFKRLREIQKRGKYIPQ